MVPDTAKLAPISKHKIISGKRKSNRINSCFSVPALKKVCNTSFGEIEMTPILKLTKIMLTINTIKISTIFQNGGCLLSVYDTIPLLLSIELNKGRTAHQSTTYLHQPAFHKAHSPFEPPRPITLIIERRKWLMKE